MSRRGAVLLYVSLGMVAFAGMVALAIDVAHVRLVKLELQGAADAATRAAAQQLQGGVSAASAAAVAAAADSTADGSPVVIDPNADIDFGSWSGGTFTPLSGAARANANAVRVRCVRAAARGNGVTAAFASFLGIGSADVTAQAIATGVPTPVAGFIGYAAVVSTNNTFFGGYNYAVTTTPTQGTADSNMRVGTNGSVSLKNNDEIKGNVVLGPHGNHSGGRVDGTTYYWGTTIPAPAMPTWTPGANPDSVPQDYTVSTNTTLPGGSYWFTSLTVNANLTFSGPAVLYVNGPITIAATLSPASRVPSDLRIYQYGSTTFSDGASNGMILFAAVVAPGADFTAKNNLDYYGSGIFNSITTKNNAEFFYDEAQGPMDGSNGVSTVQ